MWKTSGVIFHSFHIGTEKKVLNIYKQFFHIHLVENFIFAVMPWN